MLLSVANLIAGYGRVRILQDVSLGVERGEILAVIGRNGVGKTTLMRTLIGAITPMSGKIALEARDITALGPAQRARLGIGYVPQGRGIFGRMTVADNLVLGQSVGGGVGGGGAPDLDRVYRFFPILRERLGQLAGSMSGGQQQQLAIGRILAGRPSLILLDEPSEGIQPNIVQQIAGIIRRLRDEQALTVVIVEQNLDLIQAVADRCIVMDKGTIVAQLATAEIRDPAVAKRYLAI
ncbi:MAG: ABC transporter ATP-binding protein [Dongiaceae bacterium]